MTGSRPPIIVVGAGISGLSAGLDLQRAGFDVVVMDAADRVGGSLHTAEFAGGSVDVGAESFLIRRPEAVDLATELGIDVSPPIRSSALIVRGDQRHPLPPGTVFGVPGTAADLGGLLTPDEVARLDAEVHLPWDGDVTVAEFVGSRLGTAVVDRVVDPLLAGVYAGSASALSAAATLPMLTEAVSRGVGLRAAVAHVTGGNQPTQRPPFAGIRGGVGRLAVTAADAFAAAGGRIQLHHQVLAVSADDQVPGAWQVRVRDASGRVTDHRVAGIVLAAPGPVSGELLRHVTPQAAGYLVAMQVADVAVIALAVDVRRRSRGPSSGLLVPRVEALAQRVLAKAITFSSAKWDWVGAHSPDTAIVRVSIGRAGEPDASAMTDAELTAAACRDATALIGGDIDVVDTLVRRWPGSLPQYPVGHVEAMVRVMAEVEAHSGLALAGSMIAGVGIPACIASGRLAAAKVVMDIVGQTSLDEIQGSRRDRT